ncbi:MAG: HEAT repeat domain-containing protein [Planctomycetota bacterium]
MITTPRALIWGALSAVTLLGGCTATPEERFAEAAANYLRRHPTVAIPKDNPVLQAWAVKDRVMVAAIHQIAEELVKGSALRRFRAMRDLGKYGEPGAEVLRAFAEADAGLRSNLIRAGDPQVRSLAVAALRDPDGDDARAMAVLAAVRVPALLQGVHRYPVTPAGDDDRRWELIGYGHAAVETLRRAALAHTRPLGERAIALDILTRIDASVAATVAARLLTEWPTWKDGRATLRFAAATVDALIDGRHAAALPMLLRLAKERSGRYRSEALRGIGLLGTADEPVLQALAALLKDPDVRVVDGALRAGAELAPAAIAAAAAELLSEKAPRGAALTVLEVATQRPVLAVALRPQLRALATGSHVDLQRAALRTLLTSGDPQGAALLQQALGSKDPLVQNAALESLAEVTFRPELRALAPAVATLLNDPSPEIRLAAVYVAGALGDEAAAPGLITLATTARAPRTRAAAFAALGRLRTRPERALADAPLAVVTEDPGVWKRAARTMWLWGDDRIAPFWREALRHSDVALAIEGLPLLAAGTDTEDLEDAIPSALAPTMPTAVRTAAIAVYAYRGGARAAANLRTLLDDEDPAVRAAAAEALGLVGGANDVQPLAALVGASGRPSARAGAVEALGRIGGRDAARLLRAALNDLSPDVRAAAATGLGRLREGAEAGDLELLQVTAERDWSDRVAVAAAQAWARRWTGAVSVDGWKRLAGDTGRRKGFARRLAGAHALQRAGDVAAAKAVVAELQLQLATASTAPHVLALAGDLALVDPAAAAAAYAKARDLATAEHHALDAWTGIADMAALQGDLKGVEAAVAGLRVATGRPVDLPRLALRATALGDVMRDRSLRAALRRFVRQPSLSRSVLDRFRGPGVVHLASGRRLAGELLGWSGMKLVIKRDRGRVFVARSEIAHVKLDP